MGKQMGNNNSKRPQIQNQSTGNESSPNKREELLKKLEDKVEAAAKEDRRKYEEEKAKRLARERDKEDTNSELNEYGNPSNNQQIVDKNESESATISKKDEVTKMAVNPTSVNVDEALKNAMNGGIVPPAGEPTVPTNTGTEVPTGSGKEEDALKGMSISKILADSGASNLNSQAGVVTPFLQKHVYLKQLLTNNEFKHSFGMKKVGAKNADGKTTDKTKGTVSVKINIEKPGTAKVAIVNMPKVIATVFSSTEEAVGKSLFDTLSNLITGIKPEDKLETVDVVMAFNDLKKRVAMLMGGRIAEFGAYTATGADTEGKSIAVATPVNFRMERPKGADGKAIKGAPVTGQNPVTNEKVILSVCADGENHVMYQMAVPDYKVLQTIAKEGSNAVVAQESMNDAPQSTDAKQLANYRAGKTPLKRAPGAFSPLYTERNFTAISKFDTAKVFATGANQADVDAALAKATNAIANANKVTINKELKDYDVTFADAKKDQLNDQKKLPIANATVDGVQRYTAFSHRTLTGDEAKVAGVSTVIDVDRTVRDFYTGECLYVKPEDAAKIATVEFVKYNETKTKEGATRFRASKSFLTVANGKSFKEDVATYGIDDASVARLLKLTDSAIAEQAIAQSQKAAKSSKSGAASSVEVVASLMSIMA